MKRPVGDSVSRVSCFRSRPFFSFRLLHPERQSHNPPEQRTVAPEGKKEEITGPNFPLLRRQEVKRRQTDSLTSEPAVCSGWLLPPSYFSYIFSLQQEGAVQV